MPYRVKKVGSGKKPYKIQKKTDGWHTIGSSTTRAKAESSVRARRGAEHGWKPTGKPRRRY